MLRAASNTELGPYQRGLSGTEGPERLSISLDGRPYQPDEHILIGFGQSLFANDLSASEYMLSNNVPAGTLEGLMISYNLIEKAEIPCAQLTADEKRRLQLITAIHSVGKIIVLNAPFEPIASSWRERFADLLCKSAKENQRIIVVPKLIYRPECWINNEIVARVQVGQNLQRTIGFGSAPESVNEIVKEVRNILKDDELANKLSKKFLKEPEPSPAKPASINVIESHKETTDKKQKENISSNKKKQGDNPRLIHLLKLIATQVKTISLPIRLALVISVFLLLFYPDAKKNISSPSTEKAAKSPPVSAKITEDLDALISEPSEQAKEEILAKLEPESSSLAKESKTNINSPYVLDSYPIQIKQAIISTFNGELPKVRNTRKRNLPLVSSNKNKEIEKKNGIKKTNLFALLEAASNTGEDTPPPPGEFPREAQPPSDSFQPNPTEDIDAQKKREIIHQKFLDAIRKASERRKMNSGL